MRILFGVLIVVAIIVAAGKHIEQNQTIKSGFVDNTQQTVAIEEELLFVPYWTLNSKKDLSHYDTLIYFGLAADEKGIISDPGSENVDEFQAKKSPGQKTLLTLRLIDHEVNDTILDDPTLQKEIIQDTISFAKEHDFDGIVIDFETKSIGFEEVTQDTTDFITSGIQEIKRSGLEAHTLLFGDTYYRARAFDVEKIAQSSDSVMIMAYDFHKSGGGVPGPTFPTYGEDIYGYDFVTMLDEFKKDASAEKITVVVGMFGYTWDQEKNTTSLTTREAQQLYEGTCLKRNCRIEKDSESQEIKITYDGSDGGYEAWVETHESADIKIKEMEKRGISKVGYWAYSFF